MPLGTNWVSCLSLYCCTPKAGLQSHIPVTCKDSILGTGLGSLLYLGFGETQRSSSENAAWAEEKAWFLASEVQGQTPPPTSQVTSEWLLRLNASSVKWGNMFLA